jgi:regulator of sirC expression with transglutaminase-like and TPR domain
MLSRNEGLATVAQRPTIRRMSDPGSRGSQASGAGPLRDPQAAQRLRRLVEGPGGEQGSLAEGALLIAREECPGLDVDWHLATLDRLGVELAARVPGQADVRERLLALNRFLFVEKGFAGNRDNYLDPRNSLLNEVLDRRLGIPITLAIVQIEVGRRVGLPLEGLSFPQHYLVRCPLPEGAAVLDPFAGGGSLSFDALARRLGEARGGHRPSRAEVAALLTPAPRRETLARVLRNLKWVHTMAGRHAQALAAIERLLMLQPTAVAELADRAACYRRLECHAAALADYRRYLATAPEGEDAEAARAAVVELERQVARLH